VADPDAQTGAFDAAELVDGSLAADAAILDSASADGALVDAMRIDAMTADAMTADTMSVDTMSVDAITPDAMIPDAMPPDATPSPTFVYVSTLMTWSAAESHCLATFGAHLATIHSSADNTLAVTAVSSLSPPPSDGFWRTGKTTPRDKELLPTRRSTSIDPYPLRTLSCCVLNFVNRLRCPRTRTASNLLSLAICPVDPSGEGHDEELPEVRLHGLGF